ncbi:ABC-2 type transport system ATP-binding protein [Chryseolinea serpens]|uniref:ABC-2 type transport system ATP-binding protein n=1 Tax=Chryseolinea serpens TaxID=947013 RepID=A0A1M5WNH1_9BACT|nr:ABC transporter ATP-binding protein [Chryseolinea serpens]SHH88972.1 ABC-2 type transport system ATP-binding protein [Chryseolinea serpens]
MENSVIVARNLSKTYTETVLKNIDLTIRQGEIIGYIGPNGAGKSTTIKILTGIIPDFDGDVTVLGLDIRKQPVEVKKQIGYIPENAALYDTLTPLEYLYFIGQLYKMDLTVVDKKAKDLLELFELSEHRDSRMTTFSKGMRQKVLLIAGMIHNPALLFLDEPLSGLDANAVILVKEILSQLKHAGKTIFYSSHLMDVVEKISDRIIIINKGEMIANGTFAELNAQATGSLEKIFTDLTGNREHASAAGHFIDVLKS